MMYAIIIVLFLYYLALSLFAYVTVKKFLKKYRNYPRIQVPENIQSSVRMDFGKWDEKQILKGCFTRFPFHASAMVFYLSIYGIIGNLQKYLKYPKSLINFYRINCGRMIFKFCFNLIEQFDPKEKLATPLIVANHVNWIDFVYMGSCLPLISFVAMIQISKNILFDPIGRYTQIIYVDRKSADNRHKIKQDIKKRVQQFEKDSNLVYPLAIFPQGSTTNGRSLMRFNNGAFQTLSNITLFSLKYQCKQFHMGYDQVSDAAHALISMCLTPTLRIKKFVISATQNETVDQYRERCRAKIGEMGGFKLFDCPYKEQMDYLKKVEELAKEQRKKEK